MKPRLLVVGAGLAGLSAGVHARLSGYDVEVFEHGERPGGVCTSWAHGPYTVDPCIHWLMGSAEGGQYRALYEEVGALDGVRLLPLRHFARVVDTHGHQIDFSADLDVLPVQAGAISPHDRALFEELADAARAFSTFAPDAADAPELRGLLGSVGALWEVRRHLPLLVRFNHPMSALAQRIHHPFLRKALLSIGLGDMPVLFILVVLGQLSVGQLTRVEGGSQRFSDGIARKLLALGGRIRYGADVEEIVVEDDVAAGVRLRDGTLHRGQRVISAAPGYPTIFEMLHGRYTDDAVRERYAKWKTFTPLAIASFGVKRNWPDLPPTTHVLLDEPWWVQGHRVDVVLIRNLSDDPMLAPPGHTVVQAMFETPFDVWHDLHHEPERYQAATRRLGDEALERIAPWLPGLVPGDVAVRDIATPFTFWRFARTWKGAYEGWYPTVETVKGHVPKTLPGLSGFYMAGQWVEPGGGVPTAVMSGRHAVQLLCHDDRRAFHGELSHAA